MKRHQGFRVMESDCFFIFVFAFAEAILVHPPVNRMRITFLLVVYLFRLCCSYLSFAVSCPFLIVQSFFLLFSLGVLFLYLFFFLIENVYLFFIFLIFIIIFTYTDWAFILNFINSLSQSFSNYLNCFTINNQFIRIYTDLIKNLFLNIIITKFKII